MAIGWLTVLKMVPWGDVIVNAPKIADGAMKLWSTVSRKSALKKTSSAADAPPPPPPSTEEQAIARLQQQLVSAEAQIADLHNQMLESSELIKALADQSAGLIKRIEINRIRLLWLAGVVVVMCVVITVYMLTIITH